MKIWDNRPRYLDYKGQRLEVFTRTDMAKALNRAHSSLRAMEMKGIIPKPRLKDRRGWWCYTRDQIEDMVKLAREERVLDPNYRRTFSNRFIEEAHRILRRLPQDNKGDS